jgi:hypothetical protein
MKIPKLNLPPLHFDLDDQGAVDADLQNCAIHLVAVVAYPGSKVTDQLIGGHKVQVPNEAIHIANRQIEEYD